MESMQYMFRRLSEGQSIYIHSPYDSDSQMLYHKRRPEEETTDMGYHKDAQAQFESFEIDDGYNASPNNRAGRMIAADQCYAMRMAQSHICAETRRLRGRMPSPPLRILRKDRLELEHGPLDPSDNEDARHDSRNSENEGSQDPNQLEWIFQGTGHPEPNDAGQTAYGGLTHDALDQDYACQSMSARPQQLVGPITVPGPTQSMPPDATCDSNTCTGSSPYANTLSCHCAEIPRSRS